ncbi:hypothetical protein [Bosea sp. Leaf344]|uniref:hypothetical protein n=1 Tax=Bosea sp. Leaf344 TaxID=1736346 RepID=UPI0012E3DC7E|nr:hypothetical protein [Bosea sp. Leaf344]
MQVLLVLFVLGWIASLPAVFWWVVLGVVLLALGFGGYLLLDLNDRANFPWLDRITVDRSYLTALEAACNKAKAEARLLRTEIEQVRSVPPVAQPDATEALYRRVGLSPGAPPWLVDAARRAYRQKLHPDCHPAHRKMEAQARFVQAERIFDEIAALRA